MRIAILGAGKMGAWLARELGARGPVGVYDVRRDKAEAIRKAEVLGTLEEISGFKPEMLINAVTLPETIGAFRAAVPSLPPDCLLADVASIKGELPEYYAASG